MGMFALIAGMMGAAVCGAFIIARLNDASMARECRQCGARVRAENWSEGVCHVCRTAHQNRPAEPSTARCRFCGAAARLVQLCDAHVYCEPCVKGHDDTGTLLQWAEAGTSGVLRTKAPLATAILGYAAWGAAANVAIAALWFVFALLVVRRMQVASEVSMAMAMLGSFVCAGFAVVLIIASQVYPVCVLLRHGVLQVWGAGEWYDAPFSQCRWSMGRLSQSDVGRIPWNCRDNCLMIIMPRPDKEGRVLRIPVGGTAECTAAMRTLLELNGDQALPGGVPE